MVDLDEYLAVRTRPDARPGLYQQWHDLLFMHTAVDPELIQSTLPEGLEVDTFPDASGRERAWIGVVPFRMSGIRYPGLPAAPWISSFLELNVRTYVHVEGQRPGVWFYSLDAERWLACKIARWTYLLPYFHARMSVSLTGSDEYRYRSRRLEKPDAELDLTYRVGLPLETPKPGSLEFWLVERYLLYTWRAGKLFEGAVSHVPYSLRAAEVLAGTESMRRAAELPEGDWDHVCWSPGVKVEVYDLKPSPVLVDVRQAATARTIRP